MYFQFTNLFWISVLCAQAKHCTRCTFCAGLGNEYYNNAIGTHKESKSTVHYCVGCWKRKHCVYVNSLSTFISGFPNDHPSPLHKEARPGSARAAANVTALTCSLSTCQKSTSDFLISPRIVLQTPQLASHLKSVSSAIPQEKHSSVGRVRVPDQMSQASPIHRILIFKVISAQIKAIASQSRWKPYQILSIKHDDWQKTLATDATF